MRPTGLGEGDSLNAGDDRHTLSTSLLQPFWWRVSDLFVVFLKSKGEELSCDSRDFGVGKKEVSNELRAGFDE